MYVEVVGNAVSGMVGKNEWEEYRLGWVVARGSRGRGVNGYKRKIRTRISIKRSTCMYMKGWAPPEIYSSLFVGSVKCV